MYLTTLLSSDIVFDSFFLLISKVNGTLFYFKNTERETAKNTKKKISYIVKDQNWIILQIKLVHTLGLFPTSALVSMYNCLPLAHLNKLIVV